jgi:methyl-accepting chemotaxis protein
MHNSPQVSARLAEIKRTACIATPDRRSTRPMTEPTTLPTTAPPAAAPLAWLGAVTPTRRRAAALATAAACAALGWAGGAAGAAGALAASLVLPFLLRGPAAASDAGDADDEPRVSGGRVGAEVMVSQVVPVWGKQIDVTRESTAEGLGKLLDSFSAMAGALGTMSNGLDNFTPTIDGGAIDNALGGQAAALAALKSPSQRAFDQRDAAVAELIRCASSIDELRQLGRLAREIGKHTRLVAFNASIEAHRGSSGNTKDSGAMAVANETRTLAARMAEVGEQIDRLVSKLDRTLSAQRLSSEIDDTTPDELAMELDLRAREALNGLLGAMGGAMHGSGEIKAACHTLRTQIEETFVHFQFGDRLSQMLSIVGNDMQNFARWVAANPYASQSDAAEWLSNLEASYTMEEQRSQHHGNVHIDRGSEIEFF